MEELRFYLTGRLVISYGKGSKEGEKRAGAG